MIRFSVDLTPNELKVLKDMVLGPLMDIQGNGDLSDQDDDDLTSLNQKLLSEANLHTFSG